MPQTGAQGQRRRDARGMLAGEGCISMHESAYTCIRLREAVNENDAQQGQPISKMQNLVRKHPALTAILGSLAGVKAENSIRKLASFVGQLPENIKEDVYKTLMEE